ncbi:MAG TPA: SPOR domain-containing protein [Thermoanaerobaculia bacterium]|jgi:cell division septation protein DedD|nr:SPOR domain-containing protein [Thermoanaerobaculia bacterium]
MVSDEVLIDDQSHYEVSLTAGQAFVAFVLLLLSLAATFAFGLMIGKGQADERLVVRKEPAVINEGSVAASKKNDGKLIDLGMGNDDFKAPPPATSSAAPAPAPTITEGTITPLTESAAPVTATAFPIVEAPKPAPKPIAAPPSTGPAYAQLLVTGDQKTADALAAKAIDHGFMTTYVERAGTAFKVRVKFNSEAEARASEAKLKEISKDVWFVR